MSTVQQTAGVKVRPILFSDEMVRAILEGRKTQTRRVVKLPAWSTGDPADVEFDGDDVLAICADTGCLATIPCPYGAPGDRLYVREAWGYRSRSWASLTPDSSEVGIEYRADGAREWFDVRAASPVAGLPLQRVRSASETDDEWAAYLHAFWTTWRPSIHMPRWAARVTLEITARRAEPLHEITEADILAEGITVDRAAAMTGLPWSSLPTLHHAWRAVWDHINAARGCGWAANPAVRVLTFRRVED